MTERKRLVKAVEEARDAIDRQIRKITEAEAENSRRKLVWYNAIDALGAYDAAHPEAQP